jgi:simple sugar transport system permease protein
MSKVSDETALPPPLARIALLSLGTLRPVAALVIAFGISALLIALAGANPLTAFAAAATGAFGSFNQIAVSLTKATPYLLCSTGVALCFRANVINIGGEGQIALGGLGATWMALTFPVANPVVAILLALTAGALSGLAWAAIAAALHLGRRVHEVLITLLMNFIALLMIGEALHDGLGEAGAGFPQSPLLPRAVWLPRLMPPSSLNIGVLIALAVAVLASLLLWRTTFGFAIRATGASRRAAAYAGFSVRRVVFLVMCIGGATAGLAGAVQVMGVQYRLIEGYSTGYGFVSVAIALFGGLDPLALIPAAFFFGFLETGMASMQRQIGVPSSLVAVIEGVVMLTVLASMAAGARRARV